MFSNFQLFDRIRAFTKKGNIFRTDNLYQDQTALDRAISGGSFIDFSRQSALLEQTNLQINRLERYKDYDMMDETGEITLALNLFCLSGDTHIPLLDGTCPTIKELAESGRKEFWLYSFDIQKNEYVPTRGYNAHISGRNAEMVEVLFDDGLKIKCTPNHKFLTSNGFVEAKSLLSGQSVIPLYKTKKPPISSKHSTIVAREYEFLQLMKGRKGITKKWQAVYQWIWESLYGERNGVIHHRDLNKYNNEPSNLQLMSWKLHEEIHQKLAHLCPESEERKRIKVSEKIKLKWKDPIYRAKLIPHCRESARRLWANGKAYVQPHIEYSKVTWDILMDYINNGGDISNSHKVAKNLKCAQRVILRLLKRNNTSLSYYRQSMIQNHKVISVTPCNMETKVYDLYVEKYHCFAAGNERSWVIVHNSDESSLVDSERKHSVIVKSKNDRIRKIIEDFLYNTLLIDRELRPIIRYLCKYGDFAAEVVPTYNRDGVASFRFINVYNFTRIHTKFGDLVGFFYQDPTSLQPIFLHPWQVIHLRLTSYENAYSPYGRSVIDGGRKDFKRLRLMEDAALVYRLERAAEKLVFSIPVGNIPPKEVPQYIELIARQFKKHKFVDTSTGMVNERYNPLIQNDNIFLPKRADGTGPTIDTLPGAENLDQIADIEYFKKKMVAGLNIPFSRLGIGDTKDPDGKSLAQASPEFAKNIQWIQREVVIGLKKLCIIHLALRGHTINDIKNFDLYMTAASAIDELYRIEVWNTRADVMANLKEIGWFPPEWIIERFTDLSPDEIRQMKSIRSELGVKEESTDADERRLLTEYKEFVERVAANPIKDDIQEDSLSYLINANELDGLNKPGSNGSGATKLLVESTVPSNLSEEAIEETRKIIIGDEDYKEIEAVATQVS